MAVRASIKNAITNEAIEGVKAEFRLKSEVESSSIEKVDPILTKITKEKGIFYIQNFKDGIYLLTLHKTGFQEKTVTLNVADGDLAHLKEEMTPKPKDE